MQTASYSQLHAACFGAIREWIMQRNVRLRLQHLLCQGLIALGPLLGLTGAAQATLVVGTWDPAYGSPFPNLGWRGTATLSASENCLTFAGTVPNPTVGCPMNLVEAKVMFYNNSDPLTVLETLDFTGSSQLDSIYVDTGKITGFDLSYTGWVLSSILEAELGGNPAYFALQMSFGGGNETARLAYSADGVTLGGFNESDAVATVINIPEPASYALVLLALAGAGAATRRRR